MYVLLLLAFTFFLVDAIVPKLLGILSSNAIPLDWWAFSVLFGGTLLFLFFLAESSLLEDRSLPNAITGTTAGMTHGQFLLLLWANTFGVPLLGGWSR